jgi:hypothetical protein
VWLPENQFVGGNIEMGKSPHSNTDYAKLSAG